VTLGPSPQLTFATTLGTNVQGQPCNASTAAIRDAFAATGFNICQLGLQGTIGAAGIGLAVNAKFTLPTSWGRELGVSNASFEIGFNVSPSTPCLDLSVIQANPTAGPALDLLNKGAIIANTAMLRIAPNGCELPGREMIPAGVSLGFDGTMFGTRTIVNLKIERQGTGLKIDFTQHTGASSLGPLKFGATDVRVLLDPSKSQTTLGLKTSLAIGSGTFRVDGNFDTSGSGAARKTTLEVTATLSAKLLGASFDGNMTLHFETASAGTGTASTRADFSGRLAADLKLFKIEVEVKTLTYDSSKGGLQALDFTARAELSLGPAKAGGAIGVFYARAPEALKVSIKGNWSLWGTTVGGLDRTWDLSRIEIPYTILPKGGVIRIPVFPAVLRISGDVKGSLVWTPSTAST
jgi:hypothetical protein